MQSAKFESNLKPMNIEIIIQVTVAQHIIVLRNPKVGLTNQTCIKPMLITKPNVLLQLFLLEKDQNELLIMGREVSYKKEALCYFLCRHALFMFRKKT